MSIIKKQGFYANFDATDRLYGNNTRLLKNSHSSKGSLAKPAPIPNTNQEPHRDCIFTHDCVWNDTENNVGFTQASDASFSTICDYANKPRHTQFDDWYIDKTLVPQIKVIFDPNDGMTLKCV